MRRTTRLLTGTALAVAAAGIAVPAGAAHGADGAGGNLRIHPAAVVPGSPVTVDTTACGRGGTATGDAGAVGAGRFTLAPGAHRDEAAGEFRVPPSAQPGTYEIVAQCARGGRRITGDLVVSLAPARQPVAPRGSVKTGVGGALGPDPVQTAAGVAALAVAAAGGTWLLHRRARGDGI
ncbi:hypothetical protein ACFY30_14745 [Streptomyces sp. NPDC000345]|uniref:hypothetical protein n=1 Tax=Streptomyces sp. NPDC000345 TaxID=3364537 RepID=UPI0036BFEEF9